MTLQNISKFWYIALQVAYQQEYFGKAQDLISFTGSFKQFTLAWNVLVNSTTKVKYTVNVEEMRIAIPLCVMSYLESTWLIHKDKFVTAWISNILHFGHTTTTRVESAHAASKKWIGVLTD